MKRLFSVIWILLVACGASAQSSQVNFGKNRVQHKSFDWKYISTEHFHVYYYQEGANLAFNVARIAEEDYSRISKIVGYYPFRKINLMVYNSPGDLRQSNIGIQERAFIGGETRLIKSKKELAFTGNYVEFKRDISETVADMLINSMLFGGSLKDVVQSSYLLHMPEWFVGGAAAYIGHGWDTEMDDVVRDLVIRNNFDPRGLIGNDAKIIGQSIWNYIAVTYGVSTISSVLNLSRITHSEQMSIESAVGLAYKDFIEYWENYYLQEMAVDSLAVFADKKNRVRRFNKRKYQYNSMSYNPDSSLMAYSENFMGRERVSIINTKTGKKKLFYRKGNKLVDQQVDYSVPLVGWRSKEELSVLTYRKGTPYLFTKNIKTGKKESKYFSTFDQITSFDYNRNNNEMAITAYKNGQSDLFIYDYKEDRARRITKDLYDDIDAKYQNGTGNIVFSSNRLNDTLRQDNGDYTLITDNFNVFVYDSDKKHPVLNRVTNLPIATYNPVLTASGEAYFLMNVNHNKQLYRYNRLDSTYEQKTNFKGNISAISMSKGGEHVAYVIRNKGREFLYIDSLLNLDTTYQTLSASDFYKPEKPKEVKTFDMLLKDIDISLLTFGSDTVVKKDPAEEKKEKETNTYPNNKIYGPFPMKLKMGVDYLVTTLEIDQLRGAGALIHTSLSDMMNNHRINFDIFALTDLRSSSVSGEYELLKYRQDFRALYSRKNYLINNEFFAHNYVLNRFEVGVSHPFNEVSRVSFNPTYLNLRYTNYSFTAPLPDSVNHYAGYRVEYVFDNTKENGLNMLEGARIKIQFSTNNYFGNRFEGDSSTRFFGVFPGNSSRDFAKLNIDVRKYFKLYREMIFASRASLGQFFGPSRKNFLIGGMDSWLFLKNSSDPRGSGPNPLAFNPGVNNSEILFADYATNLRGFRYNARYGYRYFLVNNELRVPIIKMFHKAPMGSSFFRNLQVVGFYDFGTAWSQGNVFTTDNDINTQVIERPQSPFKATVTNYESPFLMGYGFGMRSMLLGYYIKFDVAWGIEDYVNQGKEFYFTFGYDF